MPAIINYKNCRDADTEIKYAEFFETIRAHKASTLYGQWAATLGTELVADKDMKEFNKEKSKLMKLLKTMKTQDDEPLCKQPGAVIDRVLWADWLIRPGDNRPDY